MLGPPMPGAKRDLLLLAIGPVVPVVLNCGVWRRRSRSKQSVIAGLALGQKAKQ